jgi:uncharacterized membrane protein
MFNLHILHNACVVTKLLLQQLKVLVTDIDIIEKLENHPDFPALLCISDSLKKWNVENIAFKISTSELQQIETPFIAHTYTEGGLYVLVKALTDTHITYTKGTGGKDTVIETIESFASNFSGVVLVAEASTQSGQEDYSISKRKQNRKQAVLPTTMAITILVLIVSWLLYTKAVFTIANIILLPIMFFAAIGLVASILLWYEVDKYNPTLQKICTGGQTSKANCDAIVNSKQGKLLGVISWGEVGFIYFAGYLLSLLMLPALGSNVLNVLVPLSILALPYTVFSIYYQGVVAKQWCRLCLIVQLVLAIMFISYALAGYIVWPLVTIHLVPAQMLAILVFFAIPTAAWYIIKPLWFAKQKNKNVQSSYNRLKYSTNVFEGLLQQQPQMLPANTNLGINIGINNANNHIVKVCNPYCGPCARAHKHLHEMLAQNSNTQLQIIFTATTNTTDDRRQPVQHLLAIQQYKKEWLHKAIDTWYLQEGITYEAFAQQYPIEEQLLEEQLPKIAAMDSWCKQQHIIGTPTIFINKQQLPDAYTVEDISYFLT